METKNETKNEKITVIRVRGEVGINRRIEETLRHLGLEHRNNCVIVENNPVVKGMIKKAKDYLTWGPASEETMKLLGNKKKRGNTYFLQPPRRGYGRKGIKVSYSKSGALGNRKEMINNLVRRML